MSSKAKEILKLLTSSGKVSQFTSMDANDTSDTRLNNAEVPTPNRAITFGEAIELDVENTPINDSFEAKGAEFYIPRDDTQQEPWLLSTLCHDIIKQLKGRELCRACRQFSSSLRLRLWILVAQLFSIAEYPESWGNKVPHKRTINQSNHDILPESSLDNIFSFQDIQRNQSFQLHQPASKLLSDSLASHDCTGCEIIRLNVTGMIYETQRRTLWQFPDTLLGNPDRRKQFWDPVRKEYYLDRHRKSFEAILYYYQTKGTLIRSSEIPLPTFEEEVRFYDLGASVLRQLLLDEGIVSSEDVPKVLPVGLLKRKVWLLLEYPESSNPARIVGLLSILAVLISTIVLCLETLPELRKENEELQFSLKDPFFQSEMICVIWFTLDYFIRLAVCPERWRFIKKTMNIFDIVSIIPYYISIFTVALPLGMYTKQDERSLPTSTLLTLRVLRLFRVFRVFHLSRHSSGLKVLGKTLKASLRELGLLLFFLLITVVIFSSLMYYAELNDPTQTFTSIPDAFWWGVVTTTSLGYGDKVPSTGLGKFIAAVCSIAAVLTLALPIPIFVANFNYFYQRENQEEGRREIFTTNYVHSCPNLPECPALYEPEFLEISSGKVKDPSDDDNLSDMSEDSTKRNRRRSNRKGQGVWWKTIKSEVQSSARLRKKRLVAARWKIAKRAIESDPPARERLRSLRPSHGLNQTHL